ncbi:hypothetical protein BRADI_5g27426v3 [Brachypodium distachyon]|uniref:Reverse transcriptase zinc-binding domain-containing protein n=1 Tax=Brachypodium distachyon TaxID=15368 RepID=A0A2K2CJM7_BRADI|nr:hypothetical protein BRADI_5g27426v3 [Brachypodium distachyon]
MECARHLVLQCPFAKEIWLLAGNGNVRISRAASAPTIKKWWFTARGGPAKDVATKREITRVAYTAWNIWKEHNRRVFEGKKLTATLVAGLINDEIEELGRILGS